MKKRVAILYGGPSSEHEVSINSGKNVLGNVDTNLFEPTEVFISKAGVFSIEGEDFALSDAIIKLKHSADIVFPVLHGAFGEDGRLQALLEVEGVSFVGSSSIASGLAIHKDAANDIYQKNGLTIPQTQIVTKADHQITIKFPIILKPISEGSSIGLFKCATQEEYDAKLEQIFATHQEMMAQEFITGREFTCGVIDINGIPTALPASEAILTTTALFDYTAKYTAGASTEVTPAEVEPAQMKALQDTAITAHIILGCKSISRTDMIMSEDGIIYVLETNTMPGMTNTSFIPAQAKAMGITMKKLVTRLLQSALK
jgi:D-alanine-D-alanine ligase